MRKVAFLFLIQIYTFLMCKVIIFGNEDKSLLQGMLWRINYFV